MSNDNVDRITRLALRCFTQTLRNNCYPKWWPRFLWNGSPPSAAYIERQAFSQQLGFDRAAIAAWSIANYDVVTPVEPMAELRGTKINGMFYDKLLGSWGIENDEREVSVNWIIGPRFGRGYVFKVQESPNGEVYLGQSKRTWIS